MTRTRLAIAALGAFLCFVGVSTGLFLLTHQQVTETEPVGPTGRALRDPFWAATLILREMDVPTFARYGLGHLPDPNSDAVVIVLADNYDHRDALAARLVEWVAAGGHVVVTPGQSELGVWDVLFEDGATFDDPARDPLLHAFDVYTEDDGDSTWMEPTVVTLERTDATGTGTVETLVTSTRLGITSSGCEAVVGLAEPGPDNVLDDGARTQVRARCAFGAGTLTAVSSSDLFENKSLQDARGDNAAFFWDTVSGTGHPSEAILVLRGDAPSFFALLWARAWPALVSLGLALLAWAGWQGQRFGPMLDRPVVARRSMLEHLDAAGSLLWRHHRLRGLTSAMRRAVRARLVRRSPGIAHLEGQAYAQAVAELTGRPVETIRQVLVEPPPRDRHAFVAMVQTLQQLWHEASPVPMGRPT